MMRSRGSMLVLVAVLTVAVGSTAFATVPPGAALVKLDASSGVDSLGVPVIAHLRDARGADYALALLTPDELAAVGVAASVLETDAAPAGYLLALERRPGARDAARELSRPLLDDGRHLLLRWQAGLDDQLARLGFDLEHLDGTPLVLRAPAPALGPDAVVFDSRVAAMLAAVTETDLWNLAGDLSGENPVTIGGSPYTITTRHTRSGTPIQKATQLAYEWFQGLGLDVEYHNWSVSGTSGRNVIAEKRGATDPDEIVIVVAHLDDMPSSGLAPGADDNGSGSAAVLKAAEVMAGRWFKRTVRWVLVTGEEQGLYGSDRYAAKVKADGDNLVAVYNMDMIAWDDVGGPVARIHTRTTGNPGYAADLVIATTFIDAVPVYGLDTEIDPVLDPDGITASDHASFWGEGFAAVLAIEDNDDDFNDYYHTSNDKRVYYNLPYYTAYTKASIATVAHLAIPTSAPCQLGVLPLGYDLDLVSGQGTSSNLNGLIEPGETVLFAPTWKYPSGCGPSQLLASTSGFATTSSLSAFLLDSDASYGVPQMQEVVNCYDKTGNCYSLKLADPAVRPALHIDAHVTETTVHGVVHEWHLHVGESFGDVPPGHWAYPFVEAVLHNGTTSGCTAVDYCPDATISRWQMAVFLAKTLFGGAPPPTGTVDGLGDYDCSPGGASLFLDVPPDDGGCASIHYIAAAGITAGCGVGSYCPSAELNRWQMAVFLAKALAAGGPIPTTGTVPGLGDFACSPGGQSVFADVAPDDPGCAHVHDMAVRQVTVGCGGSSYCPQDPLARDQMAVFMTKAFDLKLN